MKFSPWKKALVFWERVAVRPSGCWEWTGPINRNGYGNLGGREKVRKAHRVSWFYFNGPTNLHVLHKCDNPPCVNPDHLFVGTQQDNLRDMHAKKRGRGLPRVSSKEACAIRILARHTSQSELATLYGLSQSGISRIISGENHPWH